MTKMGDDAPFGAELGTGLKAYGRLLRYRPAAIPFLTAVVGRLAIAMAPLGLLLLVESERGAYGVAGVVTGAFAVGCAIGTPLWGRLMDRLGQIRTLLPTSLVSALFLTVDAVATVAGAPLPVLIVLAGLAGFAFPPLSPAIRSAWRVIFPNPASRRVAFALDATAVELLFVLGPLLLSLLLALTSPMVPVLVAAGCMAVGGVGYCRTSAARRSRPGIHPPTVLGHPGVRHHRSAITVPGVAAVLVVMLALSTGFGQLDTSMAGTAGELLGGTDRVGILFMAIAGGSSVGGLIFGSRNWPISERRALMLTTGGFATLLVAIALLVGTGRPSLWLLLPLLFCTGLTIAPSLIMMQGLVDHLTPTNRLNEAQSMLSSVNQVGAAVGTALAGMLIDAHGVGWSFGGAALAVAICCVASVGSQRHWGRSMSAAHPITPPAAEPAAESAC
ncbi:MFS transporter [Microlunatus elymi]|nr:MFS transporter [Microlunatus elymi]